MYPNTSMVPPDGPPSIWLLNDGTADNDITFNGPGALLSHYCRRG